MIVLASPGEGAIRAIEVLSGVYIDTTVDWILLSMYIDTTIDWMLMVVKVDTSVD